MMGSRCGLCKHWYSNEVTKDGCTKDRRYLHDPDCPNYESDVWE